MSLSQVVDYLCEGADEVVETSCAIIILKKDKAYKIKKSVDYGFLDFTTPEKRRTALMRELRFNQRLAADIYLGVEEITGESVLVMRRFDRSAVLSELSEAQSDWCPDAGMLRELGQSIARFHAGSEVCRESTHAGNVRYVIDSNRYNISHFRKVLGAEAVDAYDVAIAAVCDAMEPVVLDRFAAGQIRHCHGDLHLGNILLEHGKPVLFDCIEFNDRLSQIDILYDLAFLLMDLWVRGHHAAANQVLNVWLEQSARLEDRPADVYTGLKLLPLYMSMRAGVRCHVSANSHGGMMQARQYLAAAHNFLEISTPRLVAIGGLSGSGKSTRARREGAGLGRAPGAVVLRSDEIRKRLWGVPEYDALPAGAYSREETERVYNELFERARDCLQVGQSVILDATFREKKWRDCCLALATQERVSFSGLWLDLPAEVRGQRVKGRQNDVSDATVDIVIGQQAIDHSEISWQIETN